MHLRNSNQTSRSWVNNSSVLPNCHGTFLNDGQKKLHGIIYFSVVKNKNFETVQHFGEKCIEYVRGLGYTILRYDSITDGHIIQYWCYGSLYHLENMPTDLNISNSNFHCYEPYEGKSLSDALGPSWKLGNTLSLIK